jgi:hypothetical protein
MDRFVPAVSHLMSRVHSQLQSHPSTTITYDSAARVAQLQSIRDAVATAFQDSDLASLATTRDQVIGQQLAEVSALLAQLSDSKSRFESEFAVVLTQSEALREEAEALSQEARLLKAAFNTALGEVEETSRLWNEVGYQSNRVKLSLAVDAVWAPLSAALTALNSSASVSESKEAEPASFWNISEHTSSQLNAVASLVPMHASLIEKLRALRDHEFRGINSLSLYLQHVERDLISDLAQKISAEYVSSAETASDAIRSLNVELKQISDLKERVSSGQAWYKRYEELLDLKDAYDLRKIEIGQLNRKKQPVEQKQVELAALDRKISAIERPLLAEGARYVKLCPELTCSVGELKLLSGVDGIDLPVLGLEKDFDEEEDQRLIIQKQSRHRLLLVRPKRL